MASSPAPPLLPIYHGLFTKFLAHPLLFLHERDLEYRPLYQPVIMERGD
jgi:hypothetical protein